MIAGKSAYEVRQTLLQHDCVQILAVWTEKQVVTGDDFKPTRRRIVGLAPLQAACRSRRST